MALHRNAGGSGGSNAGGGAKPTPVQQAALAALTAMHGPKPTRGETTAVATTVWAVLVGLAFAI